jgi:hypothetical protein
MPAKKKSWTEKMNSPTVVIKKPIDKPFWGMHAGAVMCIPTPRLLDKYIRHIPSGKTVSQELMREDIALEMDADFTCPLTSGIFLRIVAEAALEQLAIHGNIQKITPFWRVIDPHGRLASKLSCGPSFIATQREAEGVL